MFMVCNVTIHFVFYQWKNISMGRARLYLSVHFNTDCSVPVCTLQHGLCSVPVCTSNTVFVLYLCVPFDVNQFHAVKQSWRNGFGGVGCGDEHYLGQVKWHIQVMVHKAAILLWVQNF